FATVGLGRAEALVDRSLSASLGLRPARVLIVSAPHRSDAGLRSDLANLFPHAHLRMVRPPHVDQAVISAYARSVIPSTYLALYRAAASTSSDWRSLTPESLCRSLRRSEQSKLRRTAVVTVRTSSQNYPCRHHLVLTGHEDPNGPHRPHADHRPPGQRRGTETLGRLGRS